MQRESPLEKSLKVFKKSEDPRFGSITLYQNPKYDSLIACKEMQINEEKAAKSYVVQLEAITKLESPYICKLLDYSITVQKDLCASFYLFRLFYESPQTDLAKELKGRSNDTGTYNHEELLHILYQQLSAFKLLEEHRIYHGDVRPVLIGLNKANWQTQLILKSDENRTKRVLYQQHVASFNNNKGLYISPMLFDAVMHNKLQYNLDPIKEDVFSLGLVMLEISLGESIQHIYKQDLTFDTDMFKKLLERFEARFSHADEQLFYSTIVTMLDLDEEERPTFIELFERMPPYEVVVRFISTLNPGKPPLHKMSLTRASQPRTLKNSRRRDDWKSDINHEYRRADKSVEKPRILPYYDEESTAIVYKDPFTSHSSHIFKKSPKSSVRTDEEPRILGKLVRTFEDIDGEMVEKIDRYEVTDSDKLVKVDNKKFKVRPSTENSIPNK